MTASHVNAMAVLISVLGLALLQKAPAAAQEYEIVNLGTLGRSSSAEGINNQGVVVGWSEAESGSGRFVYHAFVWQGGGMSDLGGLPCSEFQDNARAYAINDAGQIAGHSRANAECEGCSGCPGHGRYVDRNGDRPALWSGPADIGLPECKVICIGINCSCDLYWGQALGLNNAGTAVGYSFFPGFTDIGRYHAFRWSGGMTDLGTLPDHINSQAHDINDLGDAVGYSGSDVASFAVIWRGGGAPQGLPSLDSSVYGRQSRAFAVNNSGVVVGEAWDGQYWCGVYWDESGQIHNLGWGTARDVNEHGDIVGATVNGTLYKDGTFHDLMSMIPAGTDWVSLYPTAINDWGQIVGQGNLNGQTRAFLLNPLGMHRISGQVMDMEGGPVADVTLSTDSGDSAATDAAGNYTVTVSEDGSYTITPGKAGYSFEPPSREVTVPPDAEGQDFTALAEPLTYSISGQVLDQDGAPVADVFIGCDSGDSAVTDASGTYSLAVDEEGIYSITPSKDGYTFSPPSRTVTVPPDAASQDFTAFAVPEEYTISGWVTEEDGSPVADVTVSTDTGETAVTDGGGALSLTVPTEGTYTLTPDKPGYIFEPSERIVTVPPDAEGEDFEASAVGLEVIGIDVNQAVQDWSNSVPLVESKTTVVNVAIRHLGSEPSKALACLRGFRDGQELSPSPLHIGNKGAYISHKEDAASWRGADGVFAFLPPKDWRSGKVKFVIDRVAIEGVSEELTCGAADPNLLVCNEAAGPVPGDCGVEVSFEPVPTLKVKLLSVKLVRADGKVASGPSDADVTEAAKRLRAIYPVPNVRLQRGSLLWEGDVPPECTALNKRIEDMAAQDDSDFFHVGLLWETGCVDDGREWGGMANHIPGTAATATIYADPDCFLRNGVAHELGHLFGLHHVAHSENSTAPGCRDNPDLKCGWCGEVAMSYTNEWPYYGPVPDWPYGYAYIGPMTEEGADVNDEVWGEETNLKHTVSPSHYALMSYCKPPINNPWTWISKINYELLRTRIMETGGGNPRRPGVASAVPSDEGYRAVRGIADLDGDTAELLPVGWSQVPLQAPPPGEYVLQLLDASSNVVEEVTFQPNENMGDPFEESDVSATFPRIGTFFIPVSADPDITALSILHEGSQIAYLSASPNPPTVEVLYPNGGETLEDATVLMGWTGNDPDGDALTYTLRYSSDGGATWETLAVDWPEESYEIERSFLTGTSTGVIRVTASDGFHTATYDSDAPFTVANNAPNVYISQPENGRLYVSRQLILFEALAPDREDGDLTGEAIEWTSSLDGVLGNGTDLAIEADELSQGEHVITATGTDSGGLQASDSVTIRVMEEAPSDLADLTVSKTGSSDSVYVGDPVTYTITVTNQGPEDADGVAVVDMLPEGLTFEDATPDLGVCQEDEGEIACDLGHLAKGETASVAVGVTVSVAGTFENTAHVFGQGTDPALGNNEGAAFTLVLPPDGDRDGVPDEEDNCPLVRNPDQSDGDGDGAGDVCDGCPEDPEKVDPGVCGCNVPDVDTDEDGTPDCLDDCPEDPAKTEPGICGCGEPETDSDDDGTPDCIDLCPFDPAKTEPGVCGCGEPDIDNDGDGPLDCEDNCPDTPNPDQADTDGNGVGDACEVLAGDLDGDGDVDRNDLLVILSFRNQSAEVCLECDLDGDGRITVLDARVCVLMCTRPRCAP